MIRLINGKKYLCLDLRVMIGMIKFVGLIVMMFLSYVALIVIL